MAVIECAGCGKKANSDWAACPECGMNPATGEQVWAASVRPAVDADAADRGEPAPLGQWALWMAVASFVLPLAVQVAIPAAYTVATAVASVLWFSAIITGIVGVIRPPRAAAIVALAICVFPFVFSAVMDALT